MMTVNNLFLKIYIKLVTGLPVFKSTLGWFWRREGKQQSSFRSGKLKMTYTLQSFGDM